MMSAFVVLAVLGVSACSGGLGHAEACDPNSGEQNSGCAANLSCSSVFGATEGSCTGDNFQCFAICETDTECADQPNGRNHCQATTCGISYCDTPPPEL